MGTGKWASNMYTVAPSCHYDHPHRVSAHDQQYYMRRLLLIEW